MPAAETPRPKPPTDLGKAGKALWRSILCDLEAGWILDARELHWLEQACRTQDRLADLEAVVAKDGPTVTGSRGQVTVHPAISEARQLALLQQRLLAALELTDPRSGMRSATPAQARARRAAESRWANHTKRSAI